MAQDLAEAKLVALEKNENDIRPIAVGNCIRRLVAKAACSQRKKEIADYLAPHQYKVSTPGGAEMMIHLIQLCHLSHPDWVILKLDARNDINSVSRKSFCLKFQTTSLISFSLSLNVTLNRLS